MKKIPGFFPEAEERRSCREQLRLVMHQVPTMQAASVVVSLVLS